MISSQQTLVTKLNERFSQIATDAAVVSQMRAAQEIAKTMTSTDQRVDPAALTEDQRLRIQNTFRLVMQERESYLQMRLISTSSRGEEIVRMERVGQQLLTVPDEQLQEKGKEPYMTIARWLSSEEVRFSEISVNREHGLIDATRTPTLRVLAPVMSEGAVKSGVIVINVNYRAFLEALFQEIDPDYNVLLVDQGGNIIRYDHLTRTVRFALLEEVSAETVSILSILDKAKETGFAFQGEYVSLRDSVRATEKANGLEFDVIQFEQKSVVFASAANSVVQSAAFALFLSVLAVGAAAIWASVLSQPLRDMTRRLKQYAEGDSVASLKLPTDRQDEIGWLAVEFETLLTDMKTARELKRSIIENVTDGLMVVDGDGVIQIFNPACEAMFGFGTAEMVGKSIHVLIPETYHAQHTAYLHTGGNSAFSRVMAEGREVLARRKDGTLFPVDISIGKFQQKGVNRFCAIIRDLTSIKLTERENIRQKQALELALDGGELGLWDWDVTTDTVRFSDRWASMLGYRKEELEESFATWERLVEPDDLARTGQLLASFLKGEIPRYEAEFRMRHKDGHFLWVQSKGKIFERDADGNPTRLVGIHIDISDRKQKEIAISEQNRQLELAELVADIGHWSLRPETGETVWSEGIYKIHGVTPETHETNVSNGINFYHPDDRDVVTEAVSRAIEFGEPFSFQLRIIRPDGTIRHVVSKGEVIENLGAQGGRQVFGVFQDVTDKVESLRRLEESEAKTRTVLNNIVDGVLTINHNGLIDSCNPACAAMFGYLPEEILGSGFEKLLPEDLRSIHAENIKQILEHRESPLTGHPIEFRGLRRGGAVFDLEATFSLSFIEDRMMLTGVMRDITERKQTDNLKTEFVSTVNHELRTPLTAIQGSLDLLKHLSSGTLDEKCDRLLNLAYEGCGRLNHLVNDILDVEKIAAGKMNYRFEVAEFEPLVRNIVRQNEGLAERFDIGFRMIGSCPERFVRVDTNRFAQALGNLLSNAAKFSPANGTVSISTGIRPDGSVRVSVSDEGPGIPDSFRKRIFQRFAQADASNTRRFQGSGLGLNITKSITEAFSGTISFESEEGKGTVFHIDLPVVEPMSEFALKSA